MQQLWGVSDTQGSLMKLDPGSSPLACYWLSSFSSHTSVSLLGILSPKWLLALEPLSQCLSLERSNLTNQWLEGKGSCSSLASAQNRALKKKCFPPVWKIPVRQCFGLPTVQWVSAILPAHNILLSTVKVCQEPPEAPEVGGLILFAQSFGAGRHRELPLTDAFW